MEKVKKIWNFIVKYRDRFSIPAVITSLIITLYYGIDDLPKWISFIFAFYFGFMAIVYLYAVIQIKRMKKEVK